MLPGVTRAQIGSCNTLDVVWLDEMAR
jgi:hypothetical protein